MVETTTLMIINDVSNDYNDDDDDDNRAVITRFNLSRYYTRHCDNSGRKLIRYQNHKALQILTLTGELWGVYCGDFGENWPRYNDTAL